MASPNLTAISKVVKLSPNIISILGCNPGKMTLRGTNTYIIGNGKRYVKTFFFREVFNFSFIGLLEIKPCGFESRIRDVCS